MSTAATKSNLCRGLKRLWVSCLAGANVTTVLLLWAVCLSVYLEPSEHPRLAQAGLLFPVLLFVNVAFVVVWIATSWRWIAISVIGLVCCSNFVLDYWSINVPKDAPEGTVHVLTYNVHYMAEDPSDSIDSDKIIDFIVGSNADIICLQEYAEKSTKGVLLNNKLDSMGYATNSSGELLIASRLPFVDEQACRSDYSGNGRMACRVTNGNDTLLVINVHLQSNHISVEEKQDYSLALKNKDEHLLKSSGRIVLSRLMAAASKRQQQTDSICDFIRQNYGERILLCGDMNDTPISYTYNRFSSLLKNTWRESGWGAGISFNGTGFPVHIDHIFVSKDIDSFDARVDRSVASSDHYPVLVRIQL